MAKINRIATTVNHSHLLLVEGPADKAFFDEVCKSLRENHPNIKVAPPKEYQPNYKDFLHNGKGGVRTLLENLLSSLADESSATKKLAAIIDADYSDGCGFQETLKQVEKIASEYDFYLSEDKLNGLIFKYKYGDIEFGLWILPNNKDEGMLEDFIKACIHSDEKDLLNHAEEVVQNLPRKKFNHKVSKAEVSTWLAWQEKPGEGLYHVVEKKGLLDTNHALFQQMQQWLNKVFT